MNHLPVRNCKLVELSKVHDVRGNLSVVESGITVPFEIKRVYYLYDVPAGSDRGGHSHRDLWQIILPVSGSFTIRIDDGINSCNVPLSLPNVGLIIGPGVWRVLHSFSSNAVCIVLASQHYDEDDYIRDYDEHVTIFCGSKRIGGSNASSVS